MFRIPRGSSPGYFVCLEGNCIYKPDMTSSTRQNRDLLNLCLTCGASRDGNGRYCLSCKAKNAVYNAGKTDSIKGRRKEAGLCLRCGGVRDGKTQTCQPCIRRSIEEQKDRKARGLETTRDRRQAAGLCLDCGGAKEATASRCVPCQANQEQYRDKRKALEGRLTGVTCLNCHRPRDQETKLCSVCSQSAAAASRNWRTRRAEDGSRCMYCTEPRWHESTSCRTHFTEKIVHNFGIGKEHVERITKQLEDSNFTCFYTGLPLVPGVNASIDHVSPRSKYPELTACLDNLVWCDRQVNNLKTSLTVPELLDRCHAIVERADRIMAKHIQVSSLPQPLTIPPTFVS